MTTVFILSLVFTVFAVAMIFWLNRLHTNLPAIKVDTDVMEEIIENTKDTQDISVETWKTAKDTTL